jgi:pyruvate dehydrogenase E1 component
MNENYPQASLPANANAGVIRGMYRYQSHARTGLAPQLRLLGSGAILREVIAAGEMLAGDWQVHTEIWSVTSFAELAREARELQRWNRLHPTERAETSYVAECLAGGAPVVAATDYVSAYPNLIAGLFAAPFTALGTDGFGRSDNRGALRRYFEVDRQHIVVAALHALVKAGSLPADRVAEAIGRYALTVDSAAPWNN